MTDTPDEPRRVLIELPQPAPPSTVVGGIPRPPRPFTVGRRKSDRWIAYAALITFALLVLFVMFAAWRLGDIADALTNCPQLKEVKP